MAARDQIRDALAAWAQQRQGVHFALADMATEVEAAKHLVYHAAWLKQQGLPIKREAAMDKL